MARKVYQPTHKERATLGKHVERLDAEAPVPRVKVLNGNELTSFSLDHPDSAVACELLAEALGTASWDFVSELIQQLAYTGSRGRRVDAAVLNFMLDVVKGAKPKDELEALLAAQMAVVHLRFMTFGMQLNQAATLAQQSNAEGALNKLARTFAMQMEARKRYRTGGEQKVTVQHVSVSEGGQAIVGNVTQAGPETVPQKPNQSAQALTDARQTAMPIVGNPEGVPVPLRHGRKNGKRSSP
jgi:hypothetical protein